MAKRDSRHILSHSSRTAPHKAPRSVRSDSDAQRVTDRVGNASSRGGRETLLTFSKVCSYSTFNTPISVDALAPFSTPQ